MVKNIKLLEMFKRCLPLSTSSAIQSRAHHSILDNEDDNHQRQDIKLAHTCGSTQMGLTICCCEEIETKLLKFAYIT